jgi:hypothetical protein
LSYRCIYIRLLDASELMFSDTTIQKTNDTHASYGLASSSLETCALFPLLLKRVLFHHLVKVGDMSGMAPRFVSYFPSDAFREPCTPTETWESFVDAIASIFMNEITEVLDAFVFASVIVQGGQLDQLSHHCDRTIDTHLSGYQ